MAWLNLHHLKYFLVIAQEGSISNASKKLLVGQPALSAQLRQLEDHLGVELFVRSGKKMLITSEGEYILKYAKAIKDLEDELLSGIGNALNLQMKAFTIGCQESVPKSIMAKAISAITSTNKIKIRVLEGTGEELFDLLGEGKIDFFVGNFKPMSETREMLYQSLGKEQVSIWGPKDSINLRKNFPASLANSKFVLPGFQNPIRHDFEKFMLQHGLSFEVSVEAQDTALLKELASRGQGLLPLGEESVKSWVQGKRLVKIGSLPGVKEEYWFGMLKKKIDNDLIKLILKSLASS